MSVSEHLFRRFRPKREHRPAPTPPKGDALSIRWLGTAGHVISTGRTTILIDPYLSRPSFRKLPFPLVPDESLFSAWLPQKIDAVLLGHSHFDHLLDAPAISNRYGARIVGSGTTAAFAIASGVPEDRIDVVPPEGRTLTIGEFEITFVPSLHGRIVLGRVPFPGTVDRPPPLPRRFWHYKMGGAFGVLVRAGDRRIYHNGSADLVDAELGGARADVLLVGLAGRKATRDYLGRLTRILEPSLILPTHHDSFFSPLDSGERLLPGIDLDGFVREIRERAPKARVVMPLYRDEVWVPREGDAREVALTERESFVSPVS